MTIRRMQVEDIPVLVEFLRICFDDGGFAERGITYDSNTSIRVMLSVITGAGAAWVAVEEGRIVGIAILVVVPRIMNARQRVAMEAAWHPEPSMSKFKKFKIMVELLKAMEGWAETFRMPLVIAANSDEPRASVGRYLQRRGYMKGDTSYQKG